MAVVTISRQLGSLGSEAARLAANLLGYSLAQRELIHQAARRAGAPEAALAAIDELGLLKICPSPEACEAYRAAMRQVLEELAAGGEIVILGRAGQAALRDWPETLHVLVIAPAGLRAERVAERLHIPLRAAQAQVEASDRFRRNYLKRFYGLRWDDPKLYDLVLNTARLPVQAAAESIAQAARHLSNLSHPAATTFYEPTPTR